MSVTFHIVGAPYEKYQPLPEEEPEYWSERPCEGFYEMNLSNTNAGDFLRILGCHREAVELYGKWNLEKVDKMLKKAIKVLNTNEKNKLLKPTETRSIITFVGRDGKYITDRLNDLIRLLQAAQKHKMEVAFA